MEDDFQDEAAADEEAREEDKDDEYLQVEEELPPPNVDQKPSADEQEEEDWGWEDLTAWDQRLQQLAADTEQKKTLASAWEQTLSARLAACMTKNAKQNLNDNARVQVWFHLYVWLFCVILRPSFGETRDKFRKIQDLNLCNRHVGDKKASAYSVLSKATVYNAVS